MIFDNQEEFEEFDNIGIYTEQFKDDTPLYNLRGLLKYCKDKGIRPQDMEEEEIKKFQTN